MSELTKEDQEIKEFIHSFAPQFRSAVIETVDFIQAIKNKYIAELEEEVRDTEIEMYRAREQRDYLQKRITEDEDKLTNKTIGKTWVEDSNYRGGGYFISDPFLDIGPPKLTKEGGGDE